MKIGVAQKSKGYALLYRKCIEMRIEYMRYDDFDITIP